MNLSLRIAGSLIAATFALGLAPAAANAATGSASTPATLHCHRVLVHNSGVPGDPDYNLGQHYETRCTEKQPLNNGRPGGPKF